jgi:hypothetical protein
LHKYIASLRNKRKEREEDNLKTKYMEKLNETLEASEMAFKKAVGDAAEALAKVPADSFSPENFVFFFSFGY